MRYVAAYLLSALGGNENPEAKDIKKILESVGIEADDTRMTKVISELKGKNVNDVIASGYSKLASMPAGGAVAVASSAGAGSGGAAAPAAAAEEGCSCCIQINICIQVNSATWCSVKRTVLLNVHTRVNLKRVSETFGLNVKNTRLYKKKSEVRYKIMKCTYIYTLTGNVVNINGSGGLKCVQNRI
ncbi:large ribosomal subunit protein P2 isoform X1 [Nothobranchius furzeri]|uniref:large ribosomal subunit protein P2 isoform X1 n=1 Tax=Nothobranchius furzeri TaxID=105023 RepID=UPI0039048600